MADDLRRTLGRVCSGRGEVKSQGPTLTSRCKPCFDWLLTAQKSVFTFRAERGKEDHVTHVICGGRRRLRAAGSGPRGGEALPRRDNAARSPGGHRAAPCLPHYGCPRFTLRPYTPISRPWKRVSPSRHTCVDPISRRTWTPDPLRVELGCRA